MGHFSISNIVLIMGGGGAVFIKLQVIENWNNFAVDTPLIMDQVVRMRLI